MPAFLISILGWLAKNAFLSSITAFVGPLITGIFKLGGGIFTAIAEIIMALSKSPEGRVFLAVVIVAGLGLFGRWHYIEQGRREADTSAYARGMAAGKIAGQTLKCPAPKTPRR